jgi:hypothetical protein
MKKAIMLLSLIAVMFIFSLPAKIEAKEVAGTPLNTAFKTEVHADSYYYYLCIKCGCGWGSREPSKNHRCLCCGSWWIMGTRTFLTD